MTNKERELLIKWYDIFTEEEMTTEQAFEFIKDCEYNKHLAERVMKLMSTIYNKNI